MIGVQKKQPEGDQVDDRDIAPLADPHRIVAQVDELMAGLVALAAALTTACATSEKLLAATLVRLQAA